MTIAGPARLAYWVLVVALSAVCCHAQADLASGYRALRAGDYQRAVEAWRPLAQSGDARARAMLGFAYEHGYGVPRDPPTAMALYEQAAAQGLAIVQQDLGTRYFNGIGVPQNSARAAGWWQQAAEQGLATAQLNLGLLYGRGIGVAQDDGQAVRWLKAAADQGSARARYALGVLYATGRGVPQDLSLAAQAFAAAAPEVAEARYNLGVLAEQGVSVGDGSADPEHWYREAAAAGLEAAYVKLDLPMPDAVPAETALADEIEDSPQAEPIATPPPAQADAEVLHADWIAEQDPGSYTVQLATGVSEEAMVYFLRRGDFAYSRAYFRFLYRGEPRYTAVYGAFTSRLEARKALDALDPQQKRARPWIRTFREIQAMLTQ